MAKQPTPKPELPSGGGSFLRQKDGALVRTGGTDPFEAFSNPSQTGPEAGSKANSNAASKED